MVISQRLKKYTVLNKTRTHNVIGDLPANMTGLDAGPTPHEFIEMALATCTTLKLQVTADKKQWPLESADVEVQIGDESGEEVIITRKITLHGNLTDEQKKELLALAEGCNIHKLLEKKIKVKTSS